MNAVIGALRVVLGLDTAQFQTGLKKTQSSMASFAISFGKGALTAAAGFLSISAAIDQTNAAMEKMGQIADQSKAAGVGTDFFQAFGSQAQMAGVSIDQVSSALNTFNKNSGLAAAGKGKMVTALQALNPELLRNLQITRDQEERVRLAADAINAAGSASEKAAISSALFGDAGTKMVAVFEGGAAAMDVWAAKARDMGLIIDRELIVKADAMGDAFDIASTVLDNQLKSAFVNLAPIMIAAAQFAGDVAAGINEITDAVKALEDRSRATLEKRLDDLRNPKPIGFGGTLMDILNPAGAEEEAARIEAELRRRAIDELRGKLLMLPKASDEVVDGLGKVTAALEPLDLGISKVAVKVDSLADTVGDTLTDSFSGFADAVLSGVPALEALNDVLGNLAKQLLDSAISNFFGGLFGGGGLFKPAPKAGLDFGLGLFANGGVTDRPAIFGDAGPEAAVPLPDGRTIPVTLNGSTGAKVVVNNFGAPDAVRSETRPDGTVELFVNEAVRRVEDNMARGRYRGFGVSPGVRRT